MLRRHIALFAVAVAAAGGCKEERDPESIPFEGIEPEDKADRPKALPPPPLSSASASAGPAAPKRRLQGGVSATRIKACCSALRAGATYGDEGERAVKKQALSICTHKIAAVRAGKVSESAALSQVRAALLRGAPAACR